MTVTMDFDGGVKLGAGGMVVGIAIAFINRLRRPKAMMLEDRRSEIETTQIAVNTLNTAMGLIVKRLDECERRHEECDNRCQTLESDIRVLNRWIDVNMPQGVKNEAEL